MIDKEVVGPGIVIYRNAFPEDLNLINKFESILGKDNAQFHWNNSEVGYGEIESTHRNCKDFKYKKENIYVESLDSIELVKLHDQITEIMQGCLDEYQRSYGIVVTYQEAINVVRYEPNEFFNVHSDDGEPYRCTVSCVIYLNDDYEGGELWFNHFDLKFKPKAGDMFLFPSSYIYSHASLPITNGTKYALVVMFDRSDFAHKNDSPVYHALETR